MDAFLSMSQFDFFPQICKLFDGLMISQGYLEMNKSYLFALNISIGISIGKIDEKIGLTEVRTHESPTLEHDSFPKPMSLNLE